MTNGLTFLPVLSRDPIADNPESLSIDAGILFLIIKEYNWNDNELVIQIL